MALEISTAGPGEHPALQALFCDTFSASEGAEEGAVIRDLVHTLLTQTAASDLYVFTALDGDDIVGGALFSRLRYSDDPRSVFILSPMAVATDRQSQGIGQALLRSAIDQLRRAGVDAAITYGDPGYYGQVGFAPMTAAQAAPPLPLSQPIGWIGQSLTQAPLLPLRGACTCVSALDDPQIW